MANDFRRLPGPGASTLSRILWTAGTVLLILGAVFVGALVFVIAVGAFATAVLLAAVRLWWLRRQLRRAAAANAEEDSDEPEFGSTRRAAQPPRTLDGEYVVVERDRKGDR
jgi:hypothetical protein